MMDDGHVGNSRRLALAIGVVAAGTPVCLGIYFAVGGPFGTINDIGNAATGILSAALAWRLRRNLSGHGGTLATGAALVGAALTMVGSALVISRTTGFMFAGLVSGLGLAGIGAWLIAANRAKDATDGWPRGLRRLGLLAGGLMTFGVVLAPGIPLGLDDMATAPVWVWVGFLSWLGAYVAYPIWALWLGMARHAPAPGSALPRTASTAAE